MTDLKSMIESILLVAGRPVSLKELEKITSQSKSEVLRSIEELKSEHENSGIVLLEQNQSYLLSTNPANSSQVKDFLNAELREKLTDAAIETLAIIAYKQPASRAEIEAIRGVNSQYTIRLLMMRGLVEKTTGSDARINLYRTTHEFMQHLGIKDMKELPDFETLTASVKPPQGFADVTKPEPATS
ncbi:MAG: SMC-Scp complex subunit ScpB [Candidatus Doudnabacteria bacterium]|nr:SMC-Scp complex subunit ScpB [Candidatus Doudnabacteria bacterium]